MKATKFKDKLKKNRKNYFNKKSLINNKINYRAKMIDIIKDDTEIIKETKKTKNNINYFNTYF